MKIGRRKLLFGAVQVLGAALALAGIVGVVWLQSAPRAVE